MNTIQIAHILQKDPYTQDVFAGVYAVDRLPSTVRTYPRAYVCNTDPQDQEGEHWVAIYLDQYGHGEYFDAYGLPPLHTPFTNFLNKHAVAWRHNDQRLQGLTSKVCGHYCVFYILHRCRGFPMDTILHMFDSNFQDNDVLVHDVIVQHL
jgi:hypothetical protein